MDKIKLILFDSENDVKLKIEELLTNVEFLQISATADNEKDLLKILESMDTDVVLINSGLDDRGYKLAELLYYNYPEISTIILEDELEEDAVHKAFLSGARDVLIKPIIPSLLIDTIYKVNYMAKKKGNLHKDASVRTRINSRIGKVITLFGAKGGVGKTFIAVNVAVLLARKLMNKRIALVDLDMEFGNVALALNILPGYTVADIVDDIRNINEEDIESYMTLHETGIWVLPANTNPMPNEFINSEHIESIINILRKVFDYIIVDLPSRYDEAIHPAITAADYLLMTVTPEMAALRNSKAALITLNQHNFPKSKIKIVLNQSEHNEVMKKDVETALNYNIFAALSVDRKSAVSSINIGLPYVIKHPYSRLTRDFHRMVNQLWEPS